MISEKEYFVKYSQCGQNKQMTSFALLSLMQDTSFYINHELGIGNEYTEKFNASWIVTGWDIILNKPIKLNSSIKVSTGIYYSKGSIAMRRFIITDADDNELASATSQWLYVKLQPFRPIAIDENIKKKTIYIPKPEIEFSVKNLMEPQLIPKTRVRKKVPLFYIDGNQHMNNVRYIEEAYDFIGDKNIKRIKIQYKKALLYNDEYEICHYELDNKSVVAFRDSNNNCCVIIEVS